MRGALAGLILATILAACAPAPPHAPAFAVTRYEPFNRADTVAIALREWRLFGGRIADVPSPDRPEPSAAEKAERQPGLWQRVGEYWWIGLDPGDSEVAWTGKHDASGSVFPPSEDGRYAWSAAFISYIMRIAGAGNRFPYSAAHATYVNAAAAGKSPILRAHPLTAYAPRLGDLVCLGRGWAQTMTYRDLPSTQLWPGHCSIVVDTAPGTIGVIGGNIGDTVALSHVPIGPDSKLADSAGVVLDTRQHWFVVLQVLYDAEAEPVADQ